ncbi:Hypothetical predicted protein, partial [Marmota monax]
RGEKMRQRRRRRLRLPRAGEGWSATGERGALTKRAPPRGSRRGGSGPSAARPGCSHLARGSP